MKYSIGEICFEQFYGFWKLVEQSHVFHNLEIVLPVCSVQISL